MSTQRLKIIFVGNPVAADDSIGPVLYALVRGKLPEGVSSACVSAMGLDLLELMDGEDRVIFVDATGSGSAPGTVTVHSADISSVRVSNAAIAHGVELADILAILGVISPERVPKEMFVVGIEGRVFHWLQRGLSPETREAIPHAVESIAKLIGAPIYVSMNEIAALDSVAL